MESRNNDPHSPGPSDAIKGTPLVDDHGMDSNMNKTTSDKVESIATLKPYNFSLGSTGATPKRAFPPSNKGKKDKNFKKRGTDYEIMPGVFVPTSYDKYLTIDINSPDVDIFDVHKDIIKCCGRSPKISQQSNGKLLVETRSPEESIKLQSLSALGGIDAVCIPHPSFNQSKGITYAPQLMKYSEERLCAEFEEQGVSKVERMRKYVNGALTPQPSLILTFESTVLPEVIYAAWHKLKVKPFIPRPRRCYHCQEFGHVMTSCRAKDQGRPAVCCNCAEEEHGTCYRNPECVHCGGGHPSSSNECEVYMLEREIQATRTKEKVTFSEAREKVLAKCIRPGVSYGAVAADRRSFKAKKHVGKYAKAAPGAKRTLSKESLVEPPPKFHFSEMSKKHTADYAPVETGASTSMEVVSNAAGSDTMEMTRAVTNTSASSEAASVAPDASASLEAASVVVDASASLEAASVVADASASLEAASVAADASASLEAASALADASASLEAASAAAGANTSEEGKNISAPLDVNENESEMFASCNSLPELSYDSSLKEEKKSNNLSKTTLPSKQKKIPSPANQEKLNMPRKSPLPKEKRKKGSSKILTRTPYHQGLKR